MAPIITNSIVSKIPGLDLVAPKISAFVGDKVGELLGQDKAREIAGYKQIEEMKFGSEDSLRLAGRIVPDAEKSSILDA